MTSNSIGVGGNAGNAGGVGSSVSQLKGRSFNYSEVQGMIQAMLVATGSVTVNNGKWTLQFDQDVPGFTENQTFASLNEAADALIPIFLSGYTAILQNQKAA